MAGGGAGDAGRARPPAPCRYRHKAHLLRDLDDAAQVYPDAVWPVQIADALRALIGEANRARDQGLTTIPSDVRDTLLRQLHDGMLVGLSDTLCHGTRPGERKARLLLEVLRDRPADVLRFAHDLKVPPTSNQAERDLRPSKIQQKISGRLTSIARTEDRYTILGYLYRRQARPRQDHRAARRADRPTLDARPPRTRLMARPTTTGRHPADRQLRHALIIKADAMKERGLRSSWVPGKLGGWLTRTTREAL